MAEGITLPLDPATLAGAVSLPKASHANAELDASIALKAVFKKLYNVLFRNESSLYDTGSFKIYFLPFYIHPNLYPIYNSFSKS